MIQTLAQLKVGLEHYIIDRYDLEDILLILATISHERAAFILNAEHDRIRADNWERIADQLESI